VLAVCELVTLVLDVVRVLFISLSSMTEFSSKFNGKINDYYFSQRLNDGRGIDGWDDVARIVIHIFPVVILTSLSIFLCILLRGNCGGGWAATNVDLGSGVRVGRGYPLRCCRVCCPRLTKSRATACCENAWQTLITATFVIAHTLYARASMMQKKVEVGDTMEVSVPKFVKNMFAMPTRLHFCV